MVVLGESGSLPAAGDLWRERGDAHTTADLKPLHTRFSWTAPKGTGNVTFRILIKQGEQGKGTFFGPNTVLTLTEGSTYNAPRPTGNGTNPQPIPFGTTAVTQTVLGGTGLCCADTCAFHTRATPFCDVTATKGISTASALNSATAGRIGCKQPAITGCPYAGGAQRTPEGYCSFRVDAFGTCPASAQAAAGGAPPTQPDACFTQHAPGIQPICVCSNNPAAQPANPFAANSKAAVHPMMGQNEFDDVEEPEKSAASKITGSMVSVLVALVASFAMMSASSSSSSSRSGSSAMVCFLLLASVALVLVPQPTSAHNFIQSLHRAQEASVYVPCQPRVANQPHVQVIPNQRFEVEWASGHGDSRPSTYYLLTVHEQDYKELSRTSITAIIKDDMALAPTDSFAIPRGWNKQHIQGTGQTCNQSYWNEAKLDPTSSRRTTSSATRSTRPRRFPPRRRRRFRTRSSRSTPIATRESVVREREHSGVHALAARYTYVSDAATPCRKLGRQP